MKKAVLWQALANQKVRCQACQRCCLIASGKTGFCRARFNKNGRLYSLNYGLVPHIQVDPIEKKPFYHFRPGALVPSIGSYGCNFRCKQCLNWSSSWGEPAGTILKSVQEQEKYPVVPPEAVIDQIEQGGYQGIAFTYNEPTIWPEYVLAVARLAKKKHFFTLYVTNGSWTKQALDLIGQYLDAANIDFKGFSHVTYAKQGAFRGKVLEMARYAQKKHQIFLEITTLLIPGINDQPKELRQLCQWIAENLGPKTPLHFSQFDPQLAPDPEFQKLSPTAKTSLDLAYQIAKKAGLAFVYLWAPSAGPLASLYAQGDTICPKCGSLAIKRTGWQPKILQVNSQGRCSKCGEDLRIMR